MHDAVAAALMAGEVVLLNTDTLPGLHIRATVAGGSERLSDLKSSPTGRPFLLLFDSVDRVLEHASCADPRDEILLRRVWPGPLTALLSPKLGTPDAWAHQRASLAARVPAVDALRELIQRVGAPLYSTSANPAGEDPAQTMDEARAFFPLLASEDFGITPLGTASTVVDLTERGGVIRRPGSAPWPPPDPTKGLA